MPESLELDVLDELLPEELDVLGLVEELEAFGLLEPELLAVSLELVLGLAALEPELGPYVAELPVSPCEELPELGEELPMLLLELGDVLPMPLELAPPLKPDDEATFNAVSVWSSICPEAEMPCCCWNFFSAAFVFGPAMPSTGPALKPLSLRACCTWLTFGLSFEDDALLPMLLPALALLLELDDWSLELDDCPLQAGDWLLELCCEEPL